jgi:predicted chitinase
VSIFENLEAVFKKENLRMNEVFRKLFDLIDKGTQDNGDGILEVHEIEEATENPKIKDITNKYVVKHSSEWDKTQNMVDVLQKIVDNIDNSEFENKDEYIEMLKKEKKRIENLSFFNECRTIPDFPQSDMVYVINPIGLVNEFSNCKITMEQLKQIFKNATQIQLEGVCNEINKDCKKYELDTPLKRAHFFAQVYGETGSSMKPINESWEYSPEALKSFSKYYREHPLEAIEDGYLRDKGKIIRSANQENIGKKHFGKLNGNRTEYPEDGYNFRGRGLIQLTGYEKYSKFKEEYNLYWEGMPPDTVNNPDIINEFPYSIRSAIWFWAFYRKAYFEAKNEQDSTLVKITALINGGSTGIDDRREGFKLSYGVFK